MKVDGKAIATELLEDLTVRVKRLKRKRITPHLVVILIGDDPASTTYVRQKQIKGEGIGAKVTIINREHNLRWDELEEVVNPLNVDKKVHGIIVQRPVPVFIDKEKLAKLIVPEKDLDSFHPKSKFKMPLALAVLKILQAIYEEDHPEPVENENEPNKSGPESPFSIHMDSFTDWLKQKNIVVIGKGETGGTPVMKLLEEKGIPAHNIDSKTENPESLTKTADIVISCVGKMDIVTGDMLKEGVILLGVGMHKEEDGALHADYSEDSIKDVCSYYTPVPGGVGPVNVAMLLENLVQSAESQIPS